MEKIILVIMGRLKLSHNDLFYYSILDLKYLIEGHEIDIREDWERERIAAYVSISPHMKKNANLSPQKIWPLPWDVVKAVKELNITDIKENVSKFSERIAQHKAKVAQRKNGKFRN